MSFADKPFGVRIQTMGDIAERKFEEESAVKWVSYVATTTQIHTRLPDIPRTNRSAGTWARPNTKSKTRQTRSSALVVESPPSIHVYLRLTQRSILNAFVKRPDETLQTFGNQRVPRR